MALPCHYPEMMIVDREIVIGCPGDLVTRQFGDVAHHQRTGVHRGVQFEVLEDDGQTCRYRQISRVGPLRIVQELVLDRQPDGTLVNSVTAGQFAGGSITFRVAAVDASTSRVAVRLEAPLRGVSRLASPFLRRVVRRSLGAALAEDKHDLESSNYPARPTGSAGAQDEQELPSTGFDLGR